MQRTLWLLSFLWAQNSFAFTGWLEARPTYVPQPGEFHTENELGLGYQFSETTSLNYVQEFATNVFDPQSERGRGLDPAFGEGYLKAELGTITSLSLGAQLDYEGRLYLPTLKESRDAGMIGAYRNYFKYVLPLSSRVNFELWEMPIFYVYSQAGADGEEGPTANPWFENQVQAMASMKFLNEKLKLTLPLIWQWTRHRAYTEEAAHNDAWTHILTFYPEAIYALSDTAGLGVAFSTENLLGAEGTSLNIGDAFRDGWFQVIVSYSL